MRFWALVIVVIGLVLITPRAKAQIVTLPIPGSPLSLNVMANPQPLQNINTNPAATAHNLYDDSWVNVPLQFGFPFYGQTFDMSTMYSNGAVQFGRPVPEGSWPSWNNTFCCQGIRLNANTPEGYHYSILPLQTDLAGWSGNQHYTLGNGNSMTYGWYGVEQFGYSGNKSSFELKIDKTGGIDMRWSGAMVSYTPVTIGTVGDATKGQFTENYYGSGINLGPTQLTTGVVDQCIVNPLSSPTCSGYAEAYKTQQCAITALYDPSCSGYQQAYQTQQCTADPLYNSACPGYQQAYFTQQCSLSALYSPECPGYATAYQTYLANQACTANPQSSPSCSGYVAPVVTTTTATTTTTSTTPQLVADPVVNQAITTTSTATAPTAPAAPVQLTTSSTGSQQTTTALIVESVQDQSSSSGSSGTTTSSASTTSSAPTSASSAPTSRQSIQQARVEAARKQAIEKGAEAVKESGQAKSMDAQVATQGLVIAAMGFTPGFDAYTTVVMRDVSFYRPYTIYPGQQTIDNRSASRGLFGSTDRLHNQLVDQQFQLGK